MLSTITFFFLNRKDIHPTLDEISLAHNCALFLDKLLKYKRAVLEVMRQPLEEIIVSI